MAWEREGILTVAAVGGADQVEEDVVFGDRDEPAVAERPACRLEVAREHADLAHIR
jgi:hypothetical protein